MNLVDLEEVEMEVTLETRLLLVPSKCQINLMRMTESLHPSCHFLKVETFIGSVMLQITMSRLQPNKISSVTGNQLQKSCMNTRTFAISRSG